MEIKRQVTNVSYRIERKPDGGFIARSDDAAVPVIEAASREELTKKIQDEALSETFSGLKQLFTGQSGTGIHVERKSGPNFVLNVTASDKHEATKEEIEQFAEKFSAMAGKNFPELAKALAARAGAAQTFVGSKPVAALDSGSQKFNPSGDVVSSAPITPETSGSWKIFGVLTMLVVIGALMYFFFGHR